MRMAGRVVPGEGTSADLASLGVGIGAGAAAAVLVLLHAPWYAVGLFAGTVATAIALPFFENVKAEAEMARLHLRLAQGELERLRAPADPREAQQALAELAGLLDDWGPGKESERGPGSRPKERDGPEVGYG